MRQPKNLLVTGGSGFIGSSFIRYAFAQKGWAGKIVNLDVLTYAGNPENLTGHVIDDRYAFVREDICNQSVVEEICDEHQIDTIVHFAAESHVDRSIHGPKAFIESNIIGTFALLEAARNRPHIHFHHVSTDEVYGSLGDTGFFYEDTRYDPRSPYSASKAASDHLVNAHAHTYGLSTTMSNCSNNYGPYQFPEKLIPLMLLNCLEGKPLPIYGDGKNVRDWLYVDDHAEAVWLIVHQGQKGHTYNIGGENEWTNIDLVRALLATVAEQTGKAKSNLEGLITYVKDRPGHDRRYAINCDKIKHDLGWKPAHNFEAGLKETVAWYLGNREWVEHIQSGSYRNWIETNYGER